MAADKLEVIIEDLSTHPFCPHGPTLLFSRRLNPNSNRELFYACSACRNSKDCSVRIPWSEFETSKEKRKCFNREDEYDFAVQLRSKLAGKKPKRRRYCHTCNKPFTKTDAPQHVDHEVLVGISDDDLRQPTKFLRPIDDDKTQAQYFFTERTLNMFAKTFGKLGIKKIICMGAPSLHEYLIRNFDQLQISSFLLDIDGRFLYFLHDDEFAWYNMFNNCFLAGNRQAEKFEQFLLEDAISTDDQIVLFVDPPFGCRTEPLTQTIKTISAQYRRLNSIQTILPVFWIFPYFMETYVKNSMPEMEMCDYKMDYSNHAAYNDHRNTSRKYGSPVRIFTNIPLDRIELPTQEGYRYCSICKRWVSEENVHCNYCRECASKNGQTYKHCNLCATCVKPNYVHCRRCGRCTQSNGHDCVRFQATMNCWICREPGHAEKNCEKWLTVLRQSDIQRLSSVKKGKRICMICGKVGHHNEKRCPRRGDLLNETSFMGQFFNVFTE